MNKSVRKKRSRVGRRVSALVGALLLLVSVLIIPVSAAEFTESDVTLGGVDVWKDFDYIYGTDAGPFMNGLPMRTLVSDPLVEAPVYSAANPFVFTLSDLSVQWNPDQWTYLSVELAIFEDGSHWSVGCWERTGGSGLREVVYRFMYYDAQDSSYNIRLFERVLPDIATTRPEVIAEYWTEDVSPGVTTTMCRVFFGTENDMYEYSYTFQISRPFKIRVKTEYAEARYSKTVGDAYPQSPSYAVGYEKGQVSGNTAGFTKGFFSGSQDMFDSFKELYLEAGGPNEDLGISLNDRKELLNYFKDVGWTECANQGALTLKIVFGVLEAPLNVILGGMNFTVFGINLAETIFAVFTLIIVFAIVRVVLAVLPLV